MSGAEPGKPELPPGVSKTLLQQTKLAAEAEHADNTSEQKRQQGKKVRYGEIVQLKHVLTNKYIHMCTSQTSQRDKNNMMVSLVPC
ncbi:inositol 1,4,5-trisphosphate receptor type 3-like isoform X13 [Elysia marginata]|uniref:Inositol 1,4,5-trisphosphate receptor type 3-like isoform X13 n=1 Tax=Elysia marginata TaxID=1093978 RepID=A0AAV4EG61_9GAST|nr:inositol 1,4,5-trisphosphate receptor type 3-like isoform X13 [Elysia marginata]